MAFADAVRLIARYQHIHPSLRWPRVGTYRLLPVLYTEAGLFYEAVEVGSNTVAG